MKNILIVLGLILAFVGGYFLSQKYNFKIETKTGTPTPTVVVESQQLPEESTPTETPTKSDEELITAALAKKHGWNPDDIIVTVSKNDGQFARGGVKEKSSEVGGGMFLAVKKNGDWEIAFDGNGVPDCTELKTTYSFPSDILVGVCD